jgi:topoisomerase IV subunit B
MTAKYDESSYRKLAFPQSIRERPGMYIGRLGDGKDPDDGIYILAKEAIDNSVDEFQMGAGKTLWVRWGETQEGLEWLEIEDEGRGIPLGVLAQCATEVHGGAKFGSEAFEKSGGMNGVGIKAVNALSEHFVLESTREGKMRRLEFSKGIQTKEEKGPWKGKKKSGTRLRFQPDPSGEIFEGYAFEEAYLQRRLMACACLNPGLKIIFEKKDGTQEVFEKPGGLRDYLEGALEENEQKGKIAYEPIGIEGPDVEAVLTHGEAYGEEIHSFANGQHTREGGTHVAAMREAIVAAVRAVTGKNTEAQDIRGGLIAAISIRLKNALFESQTKTKLGSTTTEGSGRGITVRSLVGETIRRELEKALLKDPEKAKALAAKIGRNEKERRELSGIKEKSREMGKRAAQANRKLRDCKIHLTSKDKQREESTLFITEGDSASGSITQVRDAHTQAVFSLKGKPANVLGKTRRAIYENEELHLLQAALGIEESMDNLRYNRVVIATDADVDGMHIRLLLTTFFLHYFGELIREGHVGILQTPLFRVRNRKETRYCYTPAEQERALKELGREAEITRFKGLGEISPQEFKGFIGPKMRVEPLTLSKTHQIGETMEFCMGTNTPERQKYLCENLGEDQ